MKKKVCIVIYVILILITLKLLYNIVSNRILISKYDKGDYADKQAKTLTYLNFSESYIANYNYANILYKMGKYEQAIDEYKKSLKGFIPKNRECDIRINYALAICKTVSINEKDRTSIENAIEKYESAIEVLTKKGCANKENNNGHSKKAEQLKKDIQREIDRLKKLQNSNKDESDNNDEEDKKQEDINTIEEKIQNIKENATQEQRKTESLYKNYGNFDYNRVQKNW